MNVLLFEFSGVEIKTVEVGDKVWFVAKEVAEILGYERERDAINKHCKNQITVEEFYNKISGEAVSDLQKDYNKGRRETELPFKGDLQKDYNKGCSKTLQPSSSFYKNLQPHALLIQEPDIWRLIIKSRLPEAQRIETWIMEEVLPKIRKTGVYATYPELQAKFEAEVAVYKEKLATLEKHFEKDKREAAKELKEDIAHMRMFYEQYTYKPTSEDTEKQAGRQCVDELYDAYTIQCEIDGRRLGSLLEFERMLATTPGGKYMQEDGLIGGKVIVYRVFNREKFEYNYGKVAWNQNYATYYKMRCNPPVKKYSKTAVKDSWRD